MSSVLRPCPKLTLVKRWTAATCGSVWLACASPRSAPGAQLPPAPAPAAPSERLAQPLVVRDVGFDAPESVLYEPQADVYLVSNVAGAALEVDKHGFISRLSPDGSVEQLKWIDGARSGVDLHAPKGLALAGDVLYVADLRYVRKFSARTGQPLGAIAIEDASFLHDVASDDAGALYVSDSGLGPGLLPAGGDAIYRIDTDGSVRVVAQGRALGQPSGLCLTGEGLWVASFGAGELYRLAPDGSLTSGERPPTGSLDGVAVYQGRLFVSSWQGAAVYERTPQGFSERLSGLNAPADLAIDPKRKRLLVTHYTENAVSIHQL